MVEDRIGYRYAKSLFDLAKDTKKLEAVKKDIDLLNELVSENRDLRSFLRSPIIRSAKKEAVLDQLFSKSFGSDITKTLVKTIAQKGREMYLPYVGKAFVDLYDKENKITRGVLTTAEKVSDKFVKEVKKEVEAKIGGTFLVEQAIDPELIGGFVLEIGDQRFDGSVLSSLRRMKQAFSN